MSNRPPWMSRSRWWSMSQAIRRDYRPLDLKQLSVVMREVMDTIEWTRHVVDSLFRGNSLLRSLGAGR